MALYMGNWGYNCCSGVITLLTASRGLLCSFEGKNIDFSTSRLIEHGCQNAATFAMAILADQTDGEEMDVCTYACIYWIYPPPSNSGKGWFIGICYKKCNNPGPNAYTSTYTYIHICTYE